MRKTIPLFAGAILIAASVPVFAAPDNTNKAPNAAVPSSGLGCVVQGSAEDPLLYDANCSYHRVDKTNKDGSGFLRYQDKGTLQPGNVVPDKAVRIDIGDLYGPNCRGTEVVSPSGQYSSDLTCIY